MTDDGKIWAGEMSLDIMTGKNMASKSVKGALISHGDKYRVAGIGRGGRQGEERGTRGTFQEWGDLFTKRSRKPCTNKTNTTPYTH